MARRDIIVIGASAGGVEALSAVVRALPHDLAASIFVVLHVAPQAPSVLPSILERVGRLPAVHPKDDSPIEPGYIYVAPPDHHLLIDADRVRVIRGPKENRHRPAVDPLFRTAAVAYGPRVIGVILTGALDDGTAGLLAVKKRGGLALVQNPHEALYPGMPVSALQNVAVDFTLPLAEIGPKLVELSQQPAPSEDTYPLAEEMAKEVKVVHLEKHQPADQSPPGEVSAFSCPDCGGVLWELSDGELMRFRCRVGHAFSVDSMLEGHSEAIEDALWVALKTLRESAALNHRLAHQANQQGRNWMAQRFEEKLEQAQRHASLIEQVLAKDNETYLTIDPSPGNPPSHIEESA